MKTKTFFIVASAVLLAITVYAVQERAKEQSAEVKSTAAEEKPGESAGGEVALNNTMDKVSYAMGLQMGQNFKAGGVEVNLEMFVQGVRDGLSEAEPALRPEEMRQVMQDFQKEMMAKQQAEAVKNLAESKAFLEENKNKPGVTVSASGLQYKILTEGTGQRPTASDRVKVHYRGTLINGEEFDSSYKRGQPAEFAVKGIIKGWTEALQLMKKGAKWQLFIPPNLAYGQRGTPNIGPNSVLIFEVELLDIIKQEDSTRAKQPGLGQP